MNSILSKNSCLYRVLQNINIRKMTTIKKTIDKQNTKRIKELNELKLIKYEKQFLESRKLLAINPNDYKTFLTQECDHKKETSDVFHEKFDKIQTICRVYNTVMNKTFRVPSTLTNDSIKQLLELDFSEIHKQLKFMFNTEFQRWYDKQIRIEESIKTKERLNKNYEQMNASRVGIFNNNNQIVYGLWHNSLFTRIKQRHCHHLITRTRLKTSALFGQNIVIDFSYEEYMNRIAIKELLAHISRLYNFNKYKLNDSFNLSFCNLSNSGLIMKLMPNYFTKDKLIDFYINTSSESYLNQFPAEKLVYICPQADELLVEYDEEAVYVLCGVLQRRLDSMLSMSRVRSEGVKMKRIPIERYVHLKDNFSLEISEFFQILAHFRDQQDLSEAIEGILPDYSMRTQFEVETEDEERIRKLFYKKALDRHQARKKYL